MHSWGPIRTRLAQARKSDVLENSGLFAAFEQITDGIVVTDTEGEIQYVNPAFTLMTGYASQEVIGHHTRILKSGCQGVEVYRDLWNIIRSGRVWRGDMVNRRKDGTHYTETMSITPILNPSGITVRYIAIKHDVTDERAAEEARRLSLAEKTVLLQEVHHRVKNNLQVLCSLLSMEIASTPGASTVLLNAHSRVLAMALIHEQIYRSETLADLDFGVYVTLLAERLVDVYCVDRSRIRLDINVETINLSLDDAIPTGLILNELLSNSLKHAFRDGREGVIRVSLRETGNGHVELSVADDGMGLRADFDLENTGSMGLQVVRSLIFQLRAELVVTRDAGTKFKIGWKNGYCQAISN